MIILIYLAALNLLTPSNNNPYTQAMMEGKKLLKLAETPEDFTSAANHFDRIFAAEKDKWLPSYYAAFAMTIAGTLEQDPSNKDKRLDTAQSFLDKSSGLDHDASEVLALQGFIYMIRIGVDPANRGQQFSGMSSGVLQKARALNPDNPRAVLLLAQLKLGTAQFFGSDNTESCLLNDKALQLFTALDAATIDPLAPDWGQNMAEAFKAECEK